METQSPCAGSTASMAAGNIVDLLVKAVAIMTSNPLEAE
jgi:hypothetical protein